MYILGHFVLDMSGSENSNIGEAQDTSATIQTLEDTSPDFPDMQLTESDLSTFLQVCLNSGVPTASGTYRSVQTQTEECDSNHTQGLQHHNNHGLLKIQNRIINTHTLLTILKQHLNQRVQLYIKLLKATERLKYTVLHQTAGVVNRLFKMVDGLAKLNQKENGSDGPPAKISKGSDGSCNGLIDENGDVTLEQMFAIQERLQEACDELIQTCMERTATQNPDATQTPHATHNPRKRMLDHDTYNNCASASQECPTTVSVATVSSSVGVTPEARVEPAVTVNANAVVAAIDSVPQVEPVANGHMRV